MSDPHPSALRIEIDRRRLKNYLRVKWLLAWCLSLIIIGVCLSGGRFEDLSERPERVTRRELPMIVARAVGECAAGGVGLGVLLYLLFSHHIAGRVAASLELSVEGAFLRLRQHPYLLSDRKLHCRSIVDYATTQDFLTRLFDIHALQMTTTAGGQNPTITVFGIVDRLRIRDLLSEIASQREHA